MLPIIGTVLTALALPALAQDASWAGTGSDSFYWHNKYHGCLAMSAYGDYQTTCPQMFTRKSLRSNYPNSKDDPWTVVSTFGPTKDYQMEGYVVRVPEMNKIVMVFKGQPGWESYDSAQVPLLGFGCDDTCKVHAGALAAWKEIKAATNDMAAVDQHQGQLVWSAAGHGWGGMVLQVAAIHLKQQGRLYSAQTFGSAAVFNSAGANRYDSFFSGDATSSMRTVSRQDSQPAALPLGEGNGSYQFINTGIHVYGSNPTYGQNFKVCENNPWEPDCAGGTRPQDSYFYFTRMGSCCQNHDTYDADWVYSRWQQDVRSIAATGGNLVATASEASSSAASNSSASSTATPVATGPSSSASAQLTSAAEVNQAASQQGSGAQAVSMGSGFVAGWFSLLAWAVLF